MPGKTPHRNGKEPLENGVRKDGSAKDSKSKGKKAAKDGDEEMTVVVPPSKGAKQSSAPPPADAEGDVAMGEDGSEDAAVKVDPVVQAVAGTWLHSSSLVEPCRPLQNVS